jgi:hypothetical protein
LRVRGVWVRAWCMGDGEKPALLLSSFLAPFPRESWLVWHSWFGILPPFPPPPPSPPSAFSFHSGSSKPPAAWPTPRPRSSIARWRSPWFGGVVLTGGGVQEGGGVSGRGVWGPLLGGGHGMECFLVGVGLGQVHQSHPAPQIRSLPPKKPLPKAPLLKDQSPHLLWHGVLPGAAQACPRSPPTDHPTP